MAEQQDVRPIRVAKPIPSRPPRSGRHTMRRNRWLAGTLAVGMAACAADGFAPAQDAVSPQPKSASGKLGLMPQTEKINGLLAQAWKANNVRPSAKATN